MKDCFRCSNLALILGFVLAIVFSIASFSFAETDVTDKVQLTKSRMLFNRATNENYQDVSLANISEDTLLSPIKVVIDSISSSAVTVANADGTTADGKPYFEYVTDSGLLLPGEGIGQKRWIFSNPARARFRYTTSVIGTIPQAVGEIGHEGGTVEVTDPESPIFGAKVEVPEGAFLETEKIYMSESVNYSPADTGENDLKMGPVIRIESKAVFQEAIKITIPYAEMNDNELERSIQIHYSENEQSLPYKLYGGDIIKKDTVNNTITFLARHFSFHGPGIPRPYSFEDGTTYNSIEVSNYERGLRFLKNMDIISENWESIGVNLTIDENNHNLIESLDDDLKDIDEDTVEIIVGEGNLHKFIGHVIKIGDKLDNDFFDDMGWSKYKNEAQSLYELVTFSDLLPDIERPYMTDLWVANRIAKFPAMANPM